MSFYIFVSLLLVIGFADHICGEDLIPIPPRCPRIACPLLKCAPGFISTKLPTECCPSCKPDCSTVKCAQVLSCPEGQISVKRPDQCCARCEPTSQPDCRLVLCAQPICTGEQVAVTPEDQCCPRCELNCAAVSCLACAADQTAISSPDHCCPRCEPNPIQVVAQ